MLRSRGQLALVNYLTPSLPISQSSVLTNINLDWVHEQSLANILQCIESPSILFYCFLFYPYLLKFNADSLFLSPIINDMI